MDHTRGQKVKQQNTKGAENKAAESHSVLHDLHEEVRKMQLLSPFLNPHHYFYRSSLQQQQQRSLTQTVTVSGPQEDRQHMLRKRGPEKILWEDKNCTSDKGWLEKRLNYEQSHHETP